MHLTLALAVMVHSTCYGGWRMGSLNTSGPSLPLTTASCLSFQIVVVWVGTNNHGHTAEQVAGGIKAIVQLVNQRQPQARVVVLGLLPRGQHPNPLREKNRRVNELVRAALAGYPRAHFLDADPGFVHSDGTISHHDMYDYLHLSRLGYTPVCRALHSLLLRLLAQDQGQGVPLPEPTL
uniref:Platelet-activating factor acetylhydrolase IB subunit alpha1 n=1 Tax=Myotis myotis TaxID=51298 RepID=A0A7J7SCU6_MYOMY|nr:platelet activating factor acetylhydrolase 1b catalytic subunit 3 [Myotis myotis]